MMPIAPPLEHTERPRQLRVDLLREIARLEAERDTLLDKLRCVIVNHSGHWTADIHKIAVIVRKAREAVEGKTP